MSLLGIDVGTTGCKAAVFAVSGQCLELAYKEYKAPVQCRPGCFEIDAENVWNDVRNVIRQVAVKSPSNDPLNSLCVSSFGEAFVPVTKDRQILSSSILSCDDRGKRYVETLSSHMNPEDFYRINPNVLSVNYAMPKLAWLRDNQPEIYEKADYFLLWSDFIGFMMGGEACCANSLANRTLLFDLDRNDWSDKLFDLCGLDRTKMGRIVSAGDTTGRVSDAMAEKLGLPKNVKIIAGAHDQCCNALGAGAIAAGDAVCGVGTYQCITPVFDKPSQPLDFLKMGLNIEHHVVKEKYVAFIFNQAGMLLKWFREAFARDLKGNDDAYKILDAELDDEISDILVYPYFEATGAPEYAEANGIISGLRSTSTRSDIYKAVMEGVEFYFLKPLSELSELGFDLRNLTITGGGAKSDVWARLKADIYGIPVARPAFTECGLAGCAILAGLGSGAYKSIGEAVELFQSDSKMFLPNQDHHKRYQDKYQRYRENRSSS